MYEDNGNKCGKCQNHDFEVLKKGHAKDCPFKRCDCLRCRLLDARSDILQVISGKETKLKGTKKDPNCGFCQNHGVKILRKGHVRSCGFGQERHFKLDNCFDCEVHYIRNEVNRLQIKMRRAMKEDRTLSEEQRKTAREAITRAEVEKVCDLARLARKKREAILAQQAGECSAAQALLQHQTGSQASLVPSPASSSDTPGTLVNPGGAHSLSEASLLGEPPAGGASMGVGVGTSGAAGLSAGAQVDAQHCYQHLSRQLSVAAAAANQDAVWRPWSQHQVAAAMAVAQHQHYQPPAQHRAAPTPPPHHQQLVQHQLPGLQINSARQQHLLTGPTPHHLPSAQAGAPQAQLQAQQQRFFHQRNHLPPPPPHTHLAHPTGHHNHHHHSQQVGPAVGRRLVQPRQAPYTAPRPGQLSPPVTPTGDLHPQTQHQPQSLPLTQRNLQDQQQIFNTIQLFRLIAQVVQSSALNSAAEA